MLADSRVSVTDAFQISHRRPGSPLVHAAPRVAVLVRGSRGREWGCRSSMVVVLVDCALGSALARRGCGWGNIPFLDVDGPAPLVHDRGHADARDGGTRPASVRTLRPPVVLAVAPSARTAPHGPAAVDEPEQDQEAQDAADDDARDGPAAQAVVAVVVAAPVAVVVALPAEQVVKAKMPLFGRWGGHGGI